MKYDVIVIGGGLSGMLTAISLQKAGKKTAVVSAGESTLYFSKGAVKGSLSAGQVATLESLGVKLFEGGFRLTPAGELVKEDFSFSPCSVLPSDNLEGTKAVVHNFAGFPDFPTALIAAGLEKKGAKCTIREMRLAGLESSRANLTEFRSTTIAREIERNSVLADEVISTLDKDALNVLPATFYAAAQEKIISSGNKVLFVGTLPPTAPMFAFSSVLKNIYLGLGGFIFKGERAVDAVISEGKVEAVFTERLGKDALQADTFVLASGAFFSKGLMSNYQKVWEPVFGLDVNAPESRSEWLDKDFWADQPYRKFGVVTTAEGKAVKGGKVISNLYAVGSVTGEGSEYKSIVSALAVAENIMKEA